MPKTKNQDANEVRKILDVWLIVCPSTGPHYLSNNKDKALSAFAALTEAGQEPAMTKITAHKDRILEIGRNLTDKDLRDAAMAVVNKGQGLMEFRNKLVIRTHQRGEWEYVRREHNLPDITYEQMNQWLMDFMKYFTKELD